MHIAGSEGAAGLARAWAARMHAAGAGKLAATPSTARGEGACMTCIEERPGERPGT